MKLAPSHVYVHERNIVYTNGKDGISENKMRTIYPTVGRAYKNHPAAKNQNNG